MIRRIVIPALFLAILVVASPVLGDTLTLKNGKTFEGKVVKETSTHIHFKIRGLGTQKFPKSMVEKVEKGASVFDQYEAKRKELAGDDADGHFELGIWCKENTLRKEAKAEFKAAVKADPDHAGARKELGYVYYEGEWLTQKRYDEVMAEIAVRENAVISGFKTGETYKDEDAEFSVGIPTGGWEKDADSGLSVSFIGPELGKAPVTLHLEITKGESTLAENLDEFIKGRIKKLKDEFENLKLVGEAASAKLAGESAKLLTVTYDRDDITPDTIGMERLDLVARVGDGYLRFSMECREGYRDRLKPFFDKVASSVKLIKPEGTPAAGGGAPGSTLDPSFTITLPDDTYKFVDQLPFMDQNGAQMKTYPNMRFVQSTAAQVAYIVSREGLKSESGVDCTSLATLRDSIGVFMDIPVDFIKAADKGTSTKVAGQDALTGKLSLAGGRMGTGYYTVFMKGDRYYQCLFLNLGNQMGDMYVKPDFKKFLAGLKFK